MLPGHRAAHSTHADVGYKNGVERQRNTGWRYGAKAASRHLSLRTGLSASAVVAAEKGAPGPHGPLGKVEAVFGVGIPLNVGPGEGHYCPGRADAGLVMLQGRWPGCRSLCL